MPVRPRPDRIRDALLEWLDEEVTGASKRAFDTGKFLFSVSSASIGTYVAISKFSGHAWQLLDIFALIFFVLSAAVALYSTMPTKFRPNSQFDVIEAQSLIVIRTWRCAAFWSAFWGIAIVLGAIGLFLSEPKPKQEEEPTKVILINGDQ